MAFVQMGHEVIVRPSLGPEIWDLGTVPGYTGRVIRSGYSFKEALQKRKESV